MRKQKVDLSKVSLMELKELVKAGKPNKTLRGISYNKAMDILYENALPIREHNMMEQFLLCRIIRPVQSKKSRESKLILPGISNNEKNLFEYFDENPFRLIVVETIKQPCDFDPGDIVHLNPQNKSIFLPVKGYSYILVNTSFVQMVDERATHLFSKEMLEEPGFFIKDNLPDDIELCSQKEYENDMELKKS